MTSPSYQYALELSGGRPLLFIGTATGLAGAAMDSALALNQWSHLAVAFNGSQAQFYVNGTLAGTKPLTATITARGQLLRVGADADPAQFYRGALDNLRIYNRTLTASELQSDMNTGLSPHLGGGGGPHGALPAGSKHRAEALMSRPVSFLGSGQRMLSYAVRDSERSPRWMASACRRRPRPPSGGARGPASGSACC